MAVQLQCPSCKATLRLGEANVGKKIQCAHCKNVFFAMVATPPPAEEELAAEEVVDDEPAPEAKPEASGIQAGKRPSGPAKPPPLSKGPPKSPNGKTTKTTKPARRPDRKAPADGSPVFYLVALIGGFAVAALGLLGCIGGFIWLTFKAEPARPIAVGPNPAPMPMPMPIDVNKDMGKAWPIEEKKDFGVKDFKKDPPIVIDPFPDPKIDPFLDRKIDPFLDKKIGPIVGKDGFGEKKIDNPPPKFEPPAVPLVATFPPPDPAALALKPSKLEDDRVTRMLPGTIDDIAVGGGGRYLLFNLPQLRKIGMFDVNEAKVVHYFPTAGDDVKFSAGMTKLVMAFPSTNIIQRWDLISKEKELTVPLPDIGSPRMVLMGSASQGPLLVVGGKDDFHGGNRKFLNIGAFKEVDLGKQGNFAGRSFHPGHTRVSANGMVFGTWNPGSSPQGLQSYVIVGNNLTSHSQHKSMGHITPGPDGKILYTSSGRFTAECQGIGGAEENRNEYVMPAVQGDFYLNLHIAGGFGGGAKKSPTNDLSIHIGADSRPLLNVSDIVKTQGDASNSMNRWDREKFGTDKRFHFIPDADLLVVIPFSNDRFDLRRINIEQSLEKAGIDYLYVNSRAPEAVQRGTTYQYKVAIKSKKGGVKYKLDAAPNGMKVSTDGTIIWKTAADQELLEETVLLTVSDSAGQEIFHTFKVRVVADPLPNPVAKLDPKDLKFEEPKKDPVGKGFDPPKGNPVPVGDIKPVKLEAERVERMLPDTLSDICVGGGGRYLLATLPNQRKVALFDASEGKIVHYFPLASDNVRVAAGKEHAVFAFTDTKILQRWNLVTKEKELTVAAPFTETIKSITMGHNSYGPIFIGFKERAFNARTPNFLDLKFKDPEIAVTGQITGDPAFPHANADGTLFGYRHGVGGEGHEAGLVNVSGKTAKVTSIWCATSVLAGSPDSRFVYAGTCVYNTDLKVVHPDKEITQFAKPYMPALHGPYFMRLDYKQWDQHGGDIALFFQGNYTPFATIKNIDGVTNEAIAYGSNRDKLTHTQRIFLIPAANLLVSVPKTNDRLVLHQVNINDLLVKSPIDYLIVASQAPTRIGAGQKLTYKLDVRSKKGGLKFTLDAAPKGMAISPQGELTWPVPADFAPGDENIIVTIRDAAGQEMFHTFRLTIEAKD